MPFLVPACESEMELVRERTGTRSTRRSCRTHPGRIDEPDFKAGKEREVGGQKEERTVARQLVRPVVEALRDEGSERVVSSEVHTLDDSGTRACLDPANCCQRSEQLRLELSVGRKRQGQLGVGLLHDSPKRRVTHNDWNVDVLSDAVDTQEDGGHAPDEPGEVRVQVGQGRRRTRRGRGHEGWGRGDGHEPC